MKIVLRLRYFFDAEFRELRGKNAEENFNKFRVFP